MATMTDERTYGGKTIAELRALTDALPTGTWVRESPDAREEFWWAPYKVGQTLPGTDIDFDFERTAYTESREIADFIAAAREAMPDLLDALDDDDRAPRLTTKLRSYVVARDPAHGRILLGGLGALGVGQMWMDEEPYHADKPGYAEAPIEEEGRW